MTGPNHDPHSAPETTPAGRTTPAQSTENAGVEVTGPWDRISADRPIDEVATVPQVESAELGPHPASGSFGRYELLGEAKAGGMGVVYKARDTSLDRIVALKMLKSGGVAGHEEILRFQREARAVARLKHAHIVPIHDVSQEQGLHYLTMEYVAGGSLAQHRERFANDPRAVASLIEKVARAVHYAHEHAILHRDLKPANILLDEDGEPRVSDFGLAKFLDVAPAGTSALPPEPAALQPRESSSGRNSGSTPREIDLHTIGAVGTPAYMSPEQVTGGDVTRSADVWALGVILYQLLAGKTPFNGNTLQELTTQIVEAEPPPLERACPGLDPDIQAICRKCLEKDPARRYASADALANALLRWQRGGPWLHRTLRFVRRRPVLSTAAALLLAIAGTAGIVALRPPDPDRPVQLLENELAQGKPVSLIGESGPPAWYRWEVGDAASRIIPTEDSTFTIVTGNHAILELLRDPQIDSFRFSADIRQSAILGCVGLYFGRSLVNTEKTRLHFFCEWTYVEGLNGAPTRVRCNLRYCEAKTVLAGAAKATYGLLEHHDLSPIEWRHLALEVRPNEVRLSWQGQPITRKDGRPIRPRDEVDFGKWRATWPTEKIGLSPDFPAPAFAPRSGLGIFIEDCTASFRNVKIEPLPADN
jgi:serine/threonine-protein kinase